MTIPSEFTPRPEVEVVGRNLLGVHQFLDQGSDDLGSLVLGAGLTGCGYHGLSDSKPGAFCASSLDRCVAGSGGLQVTGVARPVLGVPSLPSKTVFICTLATKSDEITFMFSITNFGSVFPEPKGSKELISCKKSSFKALGEILESKYRFNSCDVLE